jgi:hypothetical protein
VKSGERGWALEAVYSKAVINSNFSVKQRFLHRASTRCAKEEPTGVIAVDIH